MSIRIIPSFIFLFFVFAIAANSYGPSTAAGNTALEPDLSRLVKGEGWQVFNRTATLIDVGAKKGVRFDEQPMVLAHPQ